jgi:hypothetical protein
MFFMRKDNNGRDGKIPEICMSGELTQGFGVGYHKCLPSADMSVGELSGQTARTSLSARHYLQIHAFGTENGNRR